MDGVWRANPPGTLRLRVIFVQRHFCGILLPRDRVEGNMPGLSTRSGLPADSLSSSVGVTGSGQRQAPFLAQRLPASAPSNGEALTGRHRGNVAGAAVPRRRGPATGGRQGRRERNVPSPKKKGRRLFGEGAGPSSWL